MSQHIVTSDGDRPYFNVPKLFIFIALMHKDTVGMKYLNIDQILIFYRILGPVTI